MKLNISISLERETRDVVARFFDAVSDLNSILSKPNALSQTPEPSVTAPKATIPPEIATKEQEKNVDYHAEAVELAKEVWREIGEAGATKIISAFTLDRGITTISQLAEADVKELIEQLKKAKSIG